jgi:hypothetical protein
VPRTHQAVRGNPARLRDETAEFWHSAANSKGEFTVVVGATVPREMEDEDESGPGLMEGTILWASQGVVFMALNRDFNSPPRNPIKKICASHPAPNARSAANPMRTMPFMLPNITCRDCYGRNAINAAKSAGP